MTEEQKELIKELHDSDGRTAIRNSICKLFPEAFQQKPERVKKVFEVEWEECILDFISKDIERALNNLFQTVRFFVTEIQPKEFSEEDMIEFAKYYYVNSHRQSNLEKSLDDYKIIFNKQERKSK